MPPISKMRLSPGGKSFAARRYASTSSTAMGWVGVVSQRGQSITGRRSVSDFIRLERQAARPDHHRRPEFDGFHAGIPEDLTDLMAAAEMRGEFRVGIVTQTTEVDDASYPGLFCCPGEVQRRLPVFPLEVLRPGHQVDEVVGGVNTLQRPVQRRRIKNVPLHDLGCRLHTGS